MRARDLDRPRQFALTLAADALAVFFILALLLIWALWKFIKRVFRRPPRPLAGA